jgi:hypothetical protein
VEIYLEFIIIEKNMNSQLTEDANKILENVDKLKIKGSTQTKLENAIKREYVTRGRLVDCAQLNRILVKLKII